MKQIEHDMIAAIRSRESLNLGNTRVTQDLDGGIASIRLFDNLIGQVHYSAGKLYLTDCGYRTATTKSRLNALLDMLTATGGGQGIYQQSGLWYWKQGEAWPGTATVRLVL
jgi:hypothetical protein